MHKENRFRNFIIASVLVHFSLLGIMYLSASLSPNKTTNEQVEITFIDVTEKQPLNPLKVVETDSANEILSEKAQFLSEKNNTVKKETKAKTGNQFRNTKNSLPQNKKSDFVKAQKQNIFAQGFDAYASMNKKEIFEKSKQTENKNAESSTTNDSLDKIENDLMTRLNTREYKYYGYYNRIKSQLNQWWVPKVQQKFTKMIKQGRTIASEENKVTKLVIVLNNAGNLVNVQVLAESGVRDLDDAAIEAFRSAAPFPNPPKGMIEGDGTVKIRWDCVVES